MTREEEIRARLGDIAPKWPWFAVEDNGRFEVRNTKGPERRGIAVTGWGNVTQSHEVADFIANTPSDIDYLLKENERLQKELDWVSGGFLNEVFGPERETK